MKTIYKYPLGLINGPQSVAIPQDGDILKVAMQGGVPTIWAEVEPGSPPEERCFQIHGTGHPIDHDGYYVGSAVGSPFVWHVYELNCE